MSKKKAVAAKPTTKVEESKDVLPVLDTEIVEVPNEEVKEPAQEPETVLLEQEPIQEEEFVVEPVIEPEDDGKEWVKDWRDLVKVEGSKDDKFGRQYYGVKR